MKIKKSKTMIKTCSERQGSYFLQFIMALLLQATSQIIWLGVFLVFVASKNVNLLESPVYLIGDLYFSVVSICLVVLYSQKVEKRSPSSLGISFFKFIHSIIGILLSWIIVGAIILVMIKATFIHVKLNNARNAVLILVYLGGFLLQGLLEEILIRAYLMNGLSTRISPIASILVSAKLFSIFHIGNGGLNLVSLLNLLLIGIMFSFLFIFTEDIISTGLIHGMWNFLLGAFWGANVSNIQLDSSLFKINILNLNTILSGGSFGLEGSIITTFPLAVVTIVLYKLIQKKQHTALL